MLDDIPPEDDVEKFATAIDGQMFTFHIDEGHKKANGLLGVRQEEASEMLKGPRAARSRRSGASPSNAPRTADSRVDRTHCLAM